MSDETKMSNTVASLVDSMTKEFNNFDFSQPRSSARSITAALTTGRAAIIEVAHTSPSADSALHNFSPADLAQRFKETEEAALCDLVASRILGIFTQLQEFERYLPIKVMIHAGTPVFLERQLQCASALHGLRALPGEMRAKRTMAAISEVASALYEPYCRGLLGAMKLLHGNRNSVPANMNFGTVVNEIKQSYSQYVVGIFESQSAWIRNAYAHDKWTYQPAQDAVEMWDQHGTSRTSGVTKLLGLVSNMFLVSGPSLGAALQTQLARTLHSDFGVATDLLGVLKDAADPSKAEAAKTQLQKYLPFVEAGMPILAEMLGSPPTSAPKT